MLTRSRKTMLAVVGIAALTLWMSVPVRAAAIDTSSTTEAPPAAPAVHDGLIEMPGETIESPAPPPTETIEYYGYDAIGSTRVVFASNGSVLARGDYLPFGEPLAADNLPPEQFTGQARDPEAGFDYFNARRYHDRLGRFGTSDPVFANALLDPQQWNRYAYARNNPLSLTDPSGLCTPEVPGHFCTENPPTGDDGFGLSNILWGFFFPHPAPNPGSNNPAPAKPVAPPRTPPKPRPGHSPPPEHVDPKDPSTWPDEGNGLEDDTPMLVMNAVTLGAGTVDAIAMKEAVGAAGGIGNFIFGGARGAVQMAEDAVYVIGRWPDTKVALDWGPLYKVLNLSKDEWSLEVNGKWLYEAISNKATFYLASPTTEENFIRIGAGGLPEPTVFGREVSALLKAGYKRVGDYLTPGVP
jgi:RHS repeat-associated protein